MTMPFSALGALPARWWRRLFGGLGVAAAVGVAAVGFEAATRARLDDSLQQATWRFYARPIVIEPGRNVDANALRRYLTRLNYRRVDQRNVGIGQYRADGDRWTVGRRAFRTPGHLDPGGVVTFQLASDGRVETVTATPGAPGPVMLEPEPLRASAPTGEDRMPVRLEDVPADLVRAVLAVEDQRFYRHPGVDPARIAGAAVANIRGRAITQGGSTITQQLAKNLFLSSRRTWLRKTRELAMALVLELRYSKEQILEAYLNQIYLGQDGGHAIHGVGRAAHFYFGKDVTELGAAESALLAGLIRGPNLYAPFHHPRSALQRRNRVLGLMRDQGMLDQPAYRRAVDSRLGVRRTASPTRAARYFSDYAARELAGTTPDHAGSTGLTAFTTLDMDLQLIAEEAVRDGLAQLEREHPALRRRDAPLQAAIVALHPETGEILAMVGGRDYGASQFNRAADARRQPGSAFKPVVALAALSGRTATLATLLEDQPLAVETAQGSWQPVNYDGAFRGPVTLRQALEKSLNVPFARLGLATGAASIIATARKLGIESPLRAVPSLALGSSEVSPLEIARAYGVLAAYGYRAGSHAVLVAIDAAGDTAYRAALNGSHAFTAEETYLVTSSLEGAVDRGTGSALRAWGYGGAIAAKSGTSSDYRDAWFVGYTPDLVLAVWVGFDDYQSLGGLSGASAALPIFARVVNATRLGRREKGFSPPPGLERVAIDPVTGLAREAGCGGEDEYFLLGTAPPAEGCWGSGRWISDAGSRLWSRIKGIFGKGKRR